MVKSFLNQKCSYSSCWKKNVKKNSYSPINKNKNKPLHKKEIRAVKKKSASKCKTKTKIDENINHKFASKLKSNKNHFQ